MATPNAERIQVEFPTNERPGTDVNTGMMLVIGVAITLAVFGAAFVIGGFFKDLLMGHPKLNVERIVFQGLILLVFSFSAATVFLKFQRLKRERKALEEVLLPEGTDLTDFPRVTEVYNRLKARPDLGDSILLTRVTRILAMWINTADFVRTAEYARKEADVDAIASDSTFRRNRLFIWAMPLGGFVGTVFGVAAGIGGFAAFLQQASVTADQIKHQVGEITTGLAVAFYCTLLGLLTAGLAAFPSLMAERKEEEVLADIDEYVEDNLISHMPSGGAIQERFPTEEIVSAIRSGMDGLQTQTKFPVEELAQAIDAGFRRLPNPERYEEVFSKAVSRAGEVINQKYEEFQTNYERRVGELGSQLGSKLEAVSNNFNSGTQRMMADFTKAQDRTLEQFTKNDQKLTDHFEELTEAVTTMGKEISEQMGDAHERYVEAVQDLDKKEIQRWEKMISDFNQLSAKLADSFKQSVATLDTASGRYSDRIQQSADKLTEQIENIQKVGSEIEKVLRTTQSMDATLRQIGGSDEFRQTLANLRTHLITSDELLKQLSKPRKMVFQEARTEE